MTHPHRITSIAPVVVPTTLPAYVDDIKHIDSAPLTSIEIPIVPSSDPLITDRLSDGSSLIAAAFNDLEQRADDATTRHEEGDPVVSGPDGSGGVIMDSDFVHVERRSLRSEAMVVSAILSMKSV